MTRITEMASINSEDHLDPFDMLDLTPETLNTMSDTELDQLRETVHEIWRTQGSKEDNDLAISASIVINNQYMLRKRELPKKDKLDEITEEFEKTAITGEDKKSSSYTYKEIFSIINLARHSRNKCMQCSKAPEFVLIWAEGMARAWFCAKHFEEFAKQHLEECAKEGFAVDIDSVKRVSDGEVCKKYGDNRNGNIWPEYKAKFNKELKKGGED